MVARPPSAPYAAARQGGTLVVATLRRWFAAWRRALSRGLAYAGAPWRDARRTLALAGTREADATLRDRGAERLAALGVRALAAGGLLGVLTAMIAHGDVRGAAGAAVASIVWAAARLGVLLFALHGTGLRRKAVIAAWAAGLLPYLGALTIGLRVAAFLASAYLTRGTMAAMGVPDVDARRATRWAFGGQAVAVGTAWLAGAVLQLL